MIEIMNPQPTIFISSIISEFYDLRGALKYFLRKNRFSVYINRKVYQHFNSKVYYFNGKIQKISLHTFVDTVGYYVNFSPTLDNFFTKIS